MKRYAADRHGGGHNSAEQHRYRLVDGLACCALSVRVDPSPVALRRRKHLGANFIIYAILRYRCEYPLFTSSPALIISPTPDITICAEPIKRRHPAIWHTISCNTQQTGETLICQLSPAASANVQPN